MKAFLQQEWQTLLGTFEVEESLVVKFQAELFENYEASGRAYHNLYHIYDLLIKLAKVESFIHDLSAVQLALWYHDIIYNPLSKNNEEKSAMLCAKRLQTMGFSADLKEKVFKLIYSTKVHHIEAWEKEEDRSDNAFLLDLDLTILGSEEKGYQDYIDKIRQEYRMVPGLLYKRGRKKILKRFLKRDRIYFTDYFFERLEDKARENVLWEVTGK